MKDFNQLITDLQKKNATQVERDNSIDLDQITKDNAEAVRDWMVEAVEGMRKDYEVQSDGQYHFGANQKTTGYNKALNDLLAQLTNKDV